MQGPRRPRPPRGPPPRAGAGRVAGSRSLPDGGCGDAPRPGPPPAPTCGREAASSRRPASRGRRESGSEGPGIGEAGTGATRRAALGQGEGREAVGGRAPARGGRRRSPAVGRAGAGSLPPARCSRFTPPVSRRAERSGVRPPVPREDTRAGGLRPPRPGPGASAHRSSSVTSFAPPVPDLRPPPRL